MASDVPGGGAGTTALAGISVLVAEDRSLIAAKIVQILHRVRCRVIGPAATLAAGLALVEGKDVCIDAAVLDIDLRGQMVYPLAEVLGTRGVPFLFLTGYGDLVIPEPWHTVLKVEKPFNDVILLGALHSIIATPPSEPSTSSISADGPP